VKTEEFAINGAADSTKVKIHWVIITLNKDQGQDQKSLIAEIVKAVRQEDEK